MSKRPRAGCAITARLALDPFHWRAQDKADWAVRLASAVEAAAPRGFRVEGYEISDTLIRVRLRCDAPAGRAMKTLRDSESIKRLHARLGDLGARAEFELEEE